VPYRERVIDARVAAALAAGPSVAIEGPRGCGKTTTATRLAASSVDLASSSGDLALAELDAHLLLDGAAPQLVDEWRLVPGLWDAIGGESAARQANGQFILTGSATCKDDAWRWASPGAPARLRMRTMTLSENRPPRAPIALRELPAVGRLSGVRSDLSYQEVATQAVRGGWPELLGADIVQAVEFNHTYLADLVNRDIPAATGSRHDPERLRLLVAALARRTAAEASIQALVTLLARGGVAIDRATVRAYLTDLAAVFAVEELPAWTGPLRSRTRLRSRSKLHLADSALACAALNIGALRLAADPVYFGRIFQALALRDLRVYADAGEGRVSHYRDETGLEVDAIVEYPDGTWAALAARLGGSQVNAAARDLVKLRDQRIDSRRRPPPLFLAVLTATEYGYTLTSGVHVVPLSALIA
jgi:predicted AAA+ superfamily ATPase